MFLKDNLITISDGKVSYVDFLTKTRITKDLDLTLNEVREQFKKLNYEKEYEETGKVINNALENYKMIPFAYMYYYLLARTSLIPTPIDVCNNYIEFFCVKNEDNTYSFKEEYLLSEDNIKFEKNELLARILRAYNSYNREVDLLIQLNNDTDISFSYDTLTDICDGIDILAKYNEKTFGIASFLGTRRSNSFKNKKNSFRHDYSKMEMIDVIGNFSGENKNLEFIGDIAVFNKEEIDKIIEKIKAA